MPKTQPLQWTQSHQPSFTSAIHSREARSRPTTCHTHANPAKGKQSTTRLTGRQVNARTKSAIRSRRWSRAVSVLTTKISRFARQTCLVNQQPTQTRLHFFVNTSVGILWLCDFAARPRRVCASTRDRNEQDLTWQSRSVFDTLARGRILTKNVTTSSDSEQPASPHICDSFV